MTAMGLLVRLVVNAVALAIAAWILPGIMIEGATTTDQGITLAIVAVIVGLVNLIVRPIVSLLALPVIILTLGLVIFVINALMLLLTDWLAEQFDVGFQVDGFWTALLGALIITVVGAILGRILPD